MQKLKIGLASCVAPSFWGSSKRLFENKYLPEMQKLSEKLDFELLVWPSDIETPSDSAAACAFMNGQGADFLLLQCTTFPGGDVILPLAELDARLGLWALPEPTETGAIPLNSFCGVNMLSSIWGQYMGQKREIKWFYGDTESEIFLERFRTTLGALRGIAAMKGAKIGLVGGIAPGFTDFAFDERKTKAKLGISVDRLPEFGDIRDRALAYENDVIAPVAEEFMAEARSVSDIVRQTMDKTARVYKAIEDLILENGYSAVALSCWPRYRKELGVVICSVIGRLLDKGYIASCEGDVDSAASMLMLKGISNGDIPMLMDLSDVDFSDDTALLWHCGSAPKRYAGKNGMCLSPHYKPGSRLPAQDDVEVGCVNDMVFSGGEITVARFTWEYEKLLLLRGELVEKPQRGFDGSRGWLSNIHIAGEKASCRDLVNTVLTAKFQHHYPLVYGNYENELFECLSWLDISPVNTIKYKPFMQKL